MSADHTLLRSKCAHVGGLKRTVSAPRRLYMYLCFVRYECYFNRSLNK